MTSTDRNCPAIVTGGCGFFGHALVQDIKKESIYSRMIVVSRNPKFNLVEGVEYRASSVTGAHFVKVLFEDVKPHIVFHTASPRRPRASSVTSTCPRLPLIIGSGDHAMIPRQVDAYEQNKTGVQLGDGKILIDVVSTENGSIAHLIAANALLHPNTAPSQVDGEAFNITDGASISFWDMTRIIWAAAGDTANPLRGSPWLWRRWPRQPMPFSPSAPRRQS
ncbi:hypothetical protein B0T10DRAFT_552490 [Thelonectria olida]|uniref:3-beta hydroxysteroid dehydrogenase/isomerase domain-containing protein n=1 Tax=Thelonectria olida TaxID=1576542 RepID=A0A9P8VU57_9HYPO|nr:hypothetical protein B0T10DRAFT_552490 [Thelonectria olida]